MYMSITETVLAKEKSRMTGNTVNATTVYVPSEIKEYLGVGDSITLDAIIAGNQLKLALSKPLYNFGIDDVVKLSDEAGFKTEYLTASSGVTVFSSIKDDLTIKYEQYRRDVIRPATVAVLKSLENVDYDAYEDISLRASRMKKKFDVIVMPEGDAGVFRVLDNPKQYKLTRKKAFRLLEGAGKKIGMSVVCRFDSKNDSIEEIKNFIDESAKLNL